MLTLHTQVSQDHMLCADACLFPASIFSRHAEITHNIHGPHDAQFYKLMDELWEVRLHALEIRSEKSEITHSKSGGAVTHGVRRPRRRFSAQSAPCTRAKRQVC